MRANQIENIEQEKIMLVRWLCYMLPSELKLHPLFEGGTALKPPETILLHAGDKKLPGEQGGSHVT